MSTNISPLTGMVRRLMHDCRITAGGEKLLAAIKNYGDMRERHALSTQKPSGWVYRATGRSVFTIDAVAAERARQAGCKVRPVAYIEQER